MRDWYSVVMSGRGRKTPIQQSAPVIGPWNEVSYRFYEGNWVISPVLFDSYSSITAAKNVAFELN